MYYMFIIHSSFDGQIGWFHFLAIETNAKTNVDIWASLARYSL